MSTLDMIANLLPENYENACFETGAIRRKRNIKNPKDLMQLCLIYLLNDFSLMEISEIAKQIAGISLSDVAFMKRFAACSDWFHWVIQQNTPVSIIEYQKPSILKEYRILAIDGSVIMEKGATPKEWHLHYALDLLNLTCHQVNLTEQSTGETLENYKVSSGDLFLGDRAYGTKNSIFYCLKNHGDFIFRLKNKAFNLYDVTGNKLKLSEELQKIGEKETKEFEVYIKSTKKTRIPLRICAKKKSEDERKKEERKIKRSNSKRQFTLSADSVITHHYMFVITSLPKNISAEEILELYRARWQVELVFKRLKSIMKLGNLPKKTKKGIFAWLNGKIMVSLLVEKRLGEIDFSPYRKGGSE